MSPGTVCWGGPTWRCTSPWRSGFLIASGGVSSLEELRRLKALGLYGAILGKALYTGALSLRGALGEVE